MIVESDKRCIVIALAILFKVALGHLLTFLTAKDILYDLTRAGVTQCSRRTNVMLVEYNVLSISKQDESILLSCVCHTLKWLANI